MNGISADIHDQGSFGFVSATTFYNRPDQGISHAFQATHGNTKKGLIINLRKGGTLFFLEFVEKLFIKLMDALPEDHVPFHKILQLPDISWP